MILTPFNRYLYSEADRIYAVDECVLLEISPSKLYLKIQTLHFTQWVKHDRVVFVEDLGKADPESIRNPDYERVTRPWTATEIVMPSKTHAQLAQEDPSGLYH